MAVFVADTDYSISTLEKYSCDFGWQKLKDDYFILLAEVKAEKKEEEISKMENEYGEIWESIRSSLKDYVANLTKKINESTDETEIKEVLKQFNDLIKNLGEIQKNERVNFHLPNSYKDLIKMEQSGSLNFGLSNQTINLFEKMKENRKKL